MSVNAFMRAYWRATKPLPTPEPINNKPMAELMRIVHKANKSTRIAPGGFAHVSVLRLGKHAALLAWIESMSDGEGHGSAALTWLCKLADRHGVILGLKIELET